ncbi:Bifunctional 34-dihydroxy-2-butanone 4-phosphate synthase-GTP cyclohydrolase II RibBA protein [Salinisphaera shabanensis E1L3A]|uniref:3,4-dihydroxy-2-butanone 4-phosphate synthase n=1 Tax=Salinisphaera shabanensis E1L3A TaxID=1033802 RepID=U2E333_9GAMM|nr:bifunctional 3,4-dihydroxy-2-butanone-4-phosphate synthase/GTP cyclohydrolase II [Salinisphaera shabanensis]ERJ18301.1 Bifunctional 34-dihydroxy-2-butanone 4-phosphate synthase-GTP cyclohydrolase II RibBA protein [Salinisphaera shabanensis E1L3A]
MAISPIEEVVDDMRNGRMVIMLDDANRENEGDLIMAAECVRSEDINFMARYGRGLICLTLTRERCRQLHLPLMVAASDEAQSTNFTLSIEAAEGVTTGISAHDRAQTVRAAVKRDAQPSDLVQPGHIFPLMSQPGGTLARAGHTEAGCDLARLAGLEPASVIVEILNEDGTMARLPDLETFAAEHDIKLGTIADLIRYRIENERTVVRVTESQVDTEFGPFTLYSFEDEVDKVLHFAMVRGDIDAETPTLVRVHVRNTLADMLGVRHGDFGWPLRDTLARVAEEGCGVVVVLRKPETARELIERIRIIEGNVPPHAPDGAGDESRILRTYGVGAQILTDLGVRRMRVLSAPMRLQGISGFGLEVVEYVQGKDDAE